MTAEERRSVLTPAAGCRVQCRRGSLDLGRNLGVRLAGVWPAGAVVLVSEPLAAGEEVAVVLEGPGNCPPAKHSGVVTACESGPGGYLAEVGFGTRLERAELLRLT
jgi:hypothetical protein